MQYESSSLARLDAFESRVSSIIDGLSSRSEFDKKEISSHGEENIYVTIKQEEIAERVFFFVKKIFREGERRQNERRAKGKIAQTNEWRQLISL